MGCKRGCGGRSSTTRVKSNVPLFKTLVTDGDIATVVAMQHVVLETPTGAYNIHSGKQQRFSRASAVALMALGAPIWIE